MDQATVKKVAEFYKQRFKEAGYEPCQDREALDFSKRLEHVAWMCEDIGNLVDEGRQPNKAMRWLGFVQGVLWSSGTCTIDEMRSHNEGDFER